MHRIDENTYIDDTLVTCAEYQLFIDEMLEQEKYYQPDHWTSYQFPVGKAREPILGVRYSDAVAFCEWLTSREDGEWIYRLLSEDEVKQYSSEILVDKIRGYWASGIEGMDKQFVWFCPIPANPRSFDIDHIYDPTLILKRTLDLARILEIDIDFTSALDIDRNINLTRDIVDNSLVDKAFNRDLNNSRSILDIAAQLDLARADAINHIFGRALNPSSNPASINNASSSFPLNLFVDIFTLQERIAGRSPAFEGIRLVKERIR